MNIWNILGCQERVLRANMSKPCAHASSGKTARNNNIFSFVVKPRGTSAHPEDLQLVMFVQEAPHIFLIYFYNVEICWLHVQSLSPTAWSFSVRWKEPFTKKRKSKPWTHWRACWTAILKNLQEYLELSWISNYIWIYIYTIICIYIYTIIYILYGIWRFDSCSPVFSHCSLHLFVYLHVSGISRLARLSSSVGVVQTANSSKLSTIISTEQKAVARYKFGRWIMPTLRKMSFLW